MTVYSVCLAQYAATGSFNEVIYTVPSGMVAVVRDAVLLHNDTVNRRLSLYTLSGSLAVYIENSQLAAPYVPVHWVGRQVLGPGEALKFLSDSGGSSYARVSGYLLTL